MALMGQAVLAIWNGIAAEAEDDFIAWHTREHMPERIGLPGFLRGKRYVAVDGRPKFFNFYETETVATLASKTYRDRLDDPTPWTRRVVPHFRDTGRTVCSTRVSLGVGEGGFIETIRFAATADAEAVVAAFADDLIPRTVAAPGVVAAHLLQGHPEESQGGSAEKAMRDQPDRISDWILFIEAVDGASLTALRAATLSDAGFGSLGADGAIDRGIYCLQYALTNRELNRSL